jgi:signal transduction histidine kinase
MATSPTTPPHPVTAAPAQRLAGEPLRVLVVEPNLDHAELMRQALADQDIRVEVSPALDALDRAHHGGHDVWVLSDAGEGLETLRVLRRAGLQTPAVVVTGKGEHGLVMALEHGATDVLGKAPGFDLLLPPLVTQAVLRPRAESALAPRLADLEQTTAHLTAQVERLQEKLAGRELELTEATRRAQEAQRQRSQLLANVSHELRTPLTTILGFTGVLLDRASGPLTPDQGNQLELIKAASTQLLALINDVLDLARLESGQTQLVTLPVDLAALLKDCAEQLTQAVGPRGITVHMESVPAMVQSDPTRLRQVLWNLCQHAARATPKGEIRLKLEALPTGARITVVDAGPGLTPEELAVLFEKFHHLMAPKGHKARGSAAGTGLGLPLAQDLALALGCRLKAHSANGAGTTFTLELPAQARVTPPRDAPARDR